jgi:hypothetical protein
MRFASRNCSRSVGPRPRHHDHIACMVSANVGERMMEGRVAQDGNGLTE